MRLSTVKLGDIAPSKPLKKPSSFDQKTVWQLNLDMVEANSGNVRAKIYRSIDSVGSSTHWFNEQHVLYSKLRPYLNKVVVPDEQGLATTEFVPLFPDPEKLDRKYLAYYLRSKNFVNWISGQVAGAKMPRVSMKIFWEHQIRIPPLDEQKRIVATLDKADAIRSKRLQALQLADDFLRSVFLEMFGEPFLNPKGWELKRFKDLGQWSSGGTPSRSINKYFEGDINWFAAKELNHRYVTKSSEKITAEAIDKSAAKIFPSGSMLIGMYDTAAFKTSIITEPSASNQACANIIPNELLDIEWFFSFLEYSKKTYLKRRRGVRQKNLNLGMIKDFELPLPPKSEQVRFAKLVKKTMLIKKNQNVSAISKDNCFYAISQKAYAGKL